MVRRRGTFLLVFTSLSVGLCFLTFVLKTTDIGALYPHLIVSEDIQTEPLSSEAPLPTAEFYSDKRCPGGRVVYDDYCVVSPYANETRNTSNVGLVTLCTQGTVEFLHHVAVLCHRWSSPVSVAVYSPQEDYVDARIMVHMLRQCDSCIRYWVSWHFFFPKDTELAEIDEFQLTRDCSSVTQVKGPKKRRSQGIYPINVGRNVARELANTPFVFSIDIELYPSLNIPAKFERMLRSHEALGSDNQVWVFPVFEVRSSVRAPLLKTELRSMFKKKLAISFHQYRCNICHRIPNLTQWMEHGDGIRVSEVDESLEPLRVWSTVKRSWHFKLQEWEPFFIGTTKDPEFDIRLSWEGKQNKMQMAFEMCMRNYDFHIIENAFLVHTPGINVYNATKDKEREKYVWQNRKIIRTVKQELIHQYGFKRDCK